MSRGSGGGPLTPRRAIALGAVQGPAELLPVSSSAHLSLIPWFAGWRWQALDPATRKAFDVALHAGSAAATIARRPSLPLDPQGAVVAALSSAPPALAGLWLERPIERRLGGPRATAAGLLAGAVAMAIADRRPRERRATELGALDGLALGLAQAAALAPGVSRNGAAIAAARWRGLGREDARELSMTIATPVVAGAAALKAMRLRDAGVGAVARRSIRLGAAAAFVSALAARRPIARLEDDRPLWPLAAYRIALAAAVAWKLRRSRPPGAVESSS